MKPITLTYGFDGFKEIRDFLSSNPKEDYTLLFYDINEDSTAEVFCSANEMLDAITLVSNTEHDFPHWIGIDNVHESYVVGLKFCMGRIATSTSYEYKDGALTKFDIEKAKANLEKKYGFQFKK